MTIMEDYQYQPLAYEGDPDDYRPKSELALVLDPSNDDGAFVENLAVFRERIAPGDRIPLHQHTVDEVFFVDEGQIDARVGDDRKTVGPGATIFIPAQVPHGFENTAGTVARVHAVFPGTEISIRYLERNPAPGTEDDPPGAPLAFAVRELLEGDPEQAVRPVETAEFESWQADE